MTGYSIKQFRKGNKISNQQKTPAFSIVQMIEISVIVED